MIFFSVSEKQKRRHAWQHWWRWWKVEQAATVSGPLWKSWELPAKQVHSGSFLTRGRKKIPQLEPLYTCVRAGACECARVRVCVCFVYIACFSGVGYRGDQCQGGFISFNAAAAGAELAGDTGPRAASSCQESTGDLSRRTVEALLSRATVGEDINTSSQ